MSTITNITNKLNIIYNIKNDIKSSLENQGQNMTGVNFENYSEKIDNLTCNLMPTRFPNINDDEAAKLPYIFNFSSCTNMAFMFQYCYNLTSIPNFNTDNVIDMTNAFSSCINLTSIPNFNTINVINMNSAFGGCVSLKTTPNYDTSNVTNMYWMFFGCDRLADVPEYNTNKVNSMYQMFWRCHNLSNESIQNIVNMCINSNVPIAQRNLSNRSGYSPLYDTKFDSTYYSNRLSDLSNAGWSY